MSDRREQDHERPVPAGTTGPEDAGTDGERDEGPLGDIAAEVRERVERGEGRDDDPDYGSEGALGKPETGEW